MLILLTGPAEDRTGQILAARFEEAGHRVCVTGPDAHLEREARTADALIDLWVVDARRKEAALARYDRWLPSRSPILACCHAASATALAAGLPRQPSRLVGFALPMPWTDRSTVECALPLQARSEGAEVEILLKAADPEVASAAGEAAEDLWRAIDLEPVWLADAVGLALPRILACLANEAFFALGEGLASAEDIDRAMRLGTRYPRGPLAWADALGLEQVLAILEALAREQGEDRYRAAPALRRLVAAGRRSVYPSSVEGAS